VHAAVHRHRDYNDSSTQNLTSSVTWIRRTQRGDDHERVWRRAWHGHNTIGAASGSINGTTNLTVTAVTAVLVSIAVTPAIPDYSGATQQSPPPDYSDSSTQT